MDDREVEAEENSVRVDSNSSSSSRFIDLIRSSDKVYIDILSKAKIFNSSYYYLSII